MEYDGCFLIVDAGREIDDILLGVAAGVCTPALTLLLFGTVIDNLFDGRPNRLGVAGMGSDGPSLVVGLLPFDMPEADLIDSGTLLSGLKKLDLRLPLLVAGDKGNCDRLSIVLSDSDCLDFFFFC